MSRVGLAEEASSQGGAVTPAQGNDSPDHAPGTGDHGSAKTDNVSAKPEVPPPDGGHNTGVTAGGAHSGVVNDRARSGQTRDPGPIDTHLASPLRYKESRHSARDSRSTFKIVGSGRRSEPSAGHTTAGRVIRNSIGLAVPLQSGKPERDNKPAASVIAPSPSAPGVSAGGAMPAVKTEPTVEHTIASRPSISAPVAINGSVGGNTTIHRGSGPAVIGGQTKAIAGISGSMITRRTR
jgi:hypothetical protein